MGEVLHSWSEFHVAMVGATAALAGLAIVAASVNIADIVKAPSITSRLAAGIAGLLLGLVGSAIGLIPGVDATTYGIVMIAASVVAGGFSIQATRRIFGNHDPANRLRTLKAGVMFAAPALYLVGGILLTAGSATGLVLFAIGSIVAIVVALIVSWVVLVEVLR